MLKVPSLNIVNTDKPDMLFQEQRGVLYRDTCSNISRTKYEY